MPLLNDATKLKQRGLHNVSGTITSGTVQLQYAVDGQAAKNVPGGLFSNTTELGVGIQLPECILTSVNTGTAEIYVNFVSNQLYLANKIKSIKSMLELTLLSSDI